MSAKIATALTALAQVFNRSLTPADLDLQVYLLAGKKEEHVLVAIKKLAETSKYYPTPGQINELVAVMVRAEIARTPLIDVPDLTPEEKTTVQSHINQFNEKMGW